MPNSHASTVLPESVGIVLHRAPRLLGIEPFTSEFIHGMESVLSGRGMSVLLQIVSSLAEELDCYRRWAQRHQVAGVVLHDLVDGDSRLTTLTELKLPAVALGEPEVSGAISTVRVDNYGAMLDAVDTVAGLGHRVIGRVSGPSRFVHTRARSDAFDVTAEKLGLIGYTVEGDYTEESGEAATRTLLAEPVRPTAIIYDNDVMAIGGLRVAQGHGIQVPEDLSLLAWDDSVLCRLAVPPLSAMSHDVRTLGTLTARSLIDILDGALPLHRRAEPPRFTARGTTGPANGASAGGSSEFSSSADALRLS